MPVRQNMKIIVLGFTNGIALLSVLKISQLYMLLGAILVCIHNYIFHILGLMDELNGK